MKQNILLIDDEIDNIEALERLFRKSYTVFKATSGLEGLEILKKNQMTIIISDQRMPGMTGVEFLKKSIPIQPHSIRILLTGFTDVESIIEAINAGQIYRYVTKPWDPIDLLNTVDKSAEKYNLRAELKNKNEQLQIALDELKALDESKNNFMLLINHELKTPLTVISSYSQLLQESTLDKVQQKSLSRIDEATHRLNRLINDSLELINAETGQTPVHIKKINPITIFNEALLPYKELIEKKGLQLNLNLGAQPLSTDKEILLKVTSHLIDNAVKFSDKNSKINISALKIKNQIEFKIESTGKAIDPKKTKLLLKPFTLDEKALNHTTGTGLGLSICQALLGLLNSNLNINPNGATTTVSFSL